MFLLSNSGNLTLTKTSMKIIITSLLTIGSVASAQLPAPGTPPPSAPPQYDPASPLPPGTVPPATMAPAATAPAGAYPAPATAPGYPAPATAPAGAYPAPATAPGYPAPATAPAGAYPPPATAPGYPAPMPAPAGAYPPPAGAPPYDPADPHAAGAHHPVEDFEPPFFEGDEMPSMITGFVVFPHEGDDGEMMVDVLGSDGLIYGLEVTDKTDMKVELPDNMEEKDILEMEPEEVAQISEGVPMTFLIEDGMITQVIEPDPAIAGTLIQDGAITELRHKIEDAIEEHMHDDEHQHPPAIDPATGVAPYPAP